MPSIEAVRLLDEAVAFRGWAAARRGGGAALSGEWECDYPDWPRAYAVLDDYLRTAAPSSAPGEELEALLYLLARDREGEQVARQIAARLPLAQLLFLAEQALVLGEAEARWQLAVRLGQAAPTGAERARLEALLLTFMRDEDEYVRRRSLQALAAQGCADTERLALAAWGETHDAQQWTRMNALEVLRQVGSSRLPALLDEAAADPREHLSRFARNLLAGKPGWSPGGAAR
jgi:hypothetical protein